MSPDISPSIEQAVCLVSSSRAKRGMTDRVALLGMTTGAGVTIDLPSRASQSHFLRTLQIRQEHRLCFGTEIWIFDHRIQLVIDRDTKRIEIGRADADPASVDHAGLGVHHLALPLPKSHAIREESPVIPSGEQ